MTCALLQAQTPVSTEARAAGVAWSWTVGMWRVWRPLGTPSAILDEAAGGLGGLSPRATAIETLGLWLAERIRARPISAFQKEPGAVGLFSVS